MSDQQELEKIISEINLYKNQAETLQQQIDAIQGSLTEIEILEATIEDITKKDSFETLVPVGAGAFMNAKIDKTNEVIMSIGAGVAVSKTIEEAKTTVEEQKNELNNTLNKLLDNLQKISQIVSQLSPKAEELMAKVQGIPQGQF
ncbi:MAG: prefoldin subunit alpha [Methanobrevibacter sp.]|jgi:prefoldin alpha subunit|nr:prefoldin subunit alpha [Candidatus Methanoflexus mossambicus]